MVWVAAARGYVGILLEDMMMEVDEAFVDL